MNSLFDGIPQLLADLRAAGVRLAVATSKAEPTARRILEHFGLDEHFEVIAGASLDGVRATQGRGDGPCTRPARAAARPRRDGRRPRPRRGGRRRTRHRHRGGRLGLRTRPTSTNRPPSPRLRMWRRSTTCARCSVSDVAAGRGERLRCLSRCTSHSSARATSAARRWRRRCSPIRSASAAWPTRCGSPAREPATGMRARAPTIARTACCANTAIRPNTGPGGSTRTTCRPISWWRLAETTSGFCATWVFRPIGCGC